MRTNDSPIVGITDAAGQVGRRVAERLATYGMRQRLIVKRSEQAPELPAAEVATIEDDADADGLARGLTGVDTVFLVPVHEHAERVRLHRAAVDAALAAGVTRIVYSSFVGAAPDSTFTLARDHYATEEYIRSSGVRLTILRGSAYLEVLRWIIGDDGVIRGPASDGRLAPVARDDMAEVVAAVVTDEDGHDGQIYDVTGPATLSLADVAAAFTRASGRTISYVDETLEEARRSRRGYGVEDWQLEAWISTYLQIARGELDVVSDTVPRLTGHPALSLDEFLAAHPESYQHLVAR